MRPFALALVPPGIDNEEQENHESKDKKDDRAGLVVPQLLEAPANVIEVHCTYNVHHCSAKCEADPMCRSSCELEGDWPLTIP